MAICQDQTHVDLQEAALTMAIAVLVERIRRLSKEDKEDLFELNKALVAAETDEEVNAIAAAYREILDQAKVAVRPLPVGDELQNGTAKWAEFVAGRIKSARLEAKMTQEDLERATGLPQSHISRLEAAVHSPSRATIEKIAKALKKPIAFFDPTAE